MAYTGLSRIGGTLEAELPINHGDAVINGNVSLGAFTYINSYSEIGSAKIGRYGSIARNVLIDPGSHPISPLSTHPFASDPSGMSAGMRDNADYMRIVGNRYDKPFIRRRAGVSIGHDVWIGANAIILGGVTIGHGSIIGAGAIVTKDVEPYSIVGGNPARHIKWRFSESIRMRLLASNWWDWDLSGLALRDYTDVEAFLDILEGAIKLNKIKKLEPRKITIRQHQIVEYQSM